ncbi:collagen alpha-1(I) chain-like [Perognathus longimembris pacificus]|uniref:collagen alpha-1(I) chain-like n=1 Tax=Perognathus longimembris pacificus TaxID=214514 RepID=UPI002018C99E|nr:collagen alpha-1(I) chain-like [Perognathus longimembris pacificus]
MAAAPRLCPLQPGLRGCVEAAGWRAKGSAHTYTYSTHTYTYSTHTYSAQTYTYSTHTYTYSAHTYSAHTYTYSTHTYSAHTYTYSTHTYTYSTHTYSTHTYTYSAHTYSAHTYSAHTYTYSAHTYGAHTYSAHTYTYSAHTYGAGSREGGRDRRIAVLGPCVPARLGPEFQSPWAPRSPGDTAAGGQCTGSRALPVRMHRSPAAGARRTQPPPQAEPRPCPPPLHPFVVLARLPFTGTRWEAASQWEAPKFCSPDRGRENARTPKEPRPRGCSASTPVTWAGGQASRGENERPALHRALLGFPPASEAASTGLPLRRKPGPGPAGSPGGGSTRVPDRCRSSRSSRAPRLTGQTEGPLPGSFWGTSWPSFPNLEFGAGARLPWARVMSRDVVWGNVSGGQRNDAQGAPRPLPASPLSRDCRSASAQARPQARVTALLPRDSRAVPSPVQGPPPPPGAARGPGTQGLGAGGCPGLPAPQGPQRNSPPPHPGALAPAPAGLRRAPPLRARQTPDLGAGTPGPGPPLGTGCGRHRGAPRFPGGGGGGARAAGTRDRPPAPRAPARGGSGSRPSGPAGPRRPRRSRSGNGRGSPHTYEPTEAGTGPAPRTSGVGGQLCTDPGHPLPPQARARGRGSLRSRPARGFRGTRSRRPERAGRGRPRPCTPAGAESPLRNGARGLFGKRPRPGPSRSLAPARALGGGAPTVPGRTIGQPAPLGPRSQWAAAGPGPGPAPPGAGGSGPRAGLARARTHAPARAAPAPPAAAAAAACARAPGGVPGRSPGRGAPGPAPGPAFSPPPARPAGAATGPAT